MQVDPNRVIEGVERLHESGPAVQQAVSVAVARKTLEVTEATTLTLLQSMQPHLG
jgi:hypothetical protein